MVIPNLTRFRKALLLWVTIGEDRTWDSHPKGMGEYQLHTESVRATEPRDAGSVAAMQDRGGDGG